MRWLVASYSPVSFFSLRPASATSSGGQTLLVPTAFALKMALLGTVIQVEGIDEARRRFSVIRDLRIALLPPEQISVMKSFAKIRRPVEFKDAKTREEKTANLMEKKAFPFQPTIAYREFVQFGSPVARPGVDTLRLALALSDDSTLSWLEVSLRRINYLGKRGGFVQLLESPHLDDNDDVPVGFTEVTRDNIEFSIEGTLQMLDDCGPTITFEHADIYNPKRITLGKERILRHVVLPYRLTRSSRGYSLYERV